MKNRGRRIFAPASTKPAKTKFEEFGPGKKGLLICKKCGVFYYKKSWHHGAEKFIARRESKDLPIKFVLCPADQMIKNGVFEGKLVIEEVPAKFKTNLVNLIKAFSKRAFERDPEDRLIAIKEEKNKLVATFTENELAAKLAQKIKEVFKKVIVKINYSKEPSDVNLTKVVFLKK